MTYQDTFSLLGGIGLFLFGMTIMSSGLKNACGNNLQNILEKATTNRAVAIFVGIAVTILIQSSSATDVMVIGFVNAGLMSLMQAVGVIMGANIGTTVTAQITAFNMTTFAPLILFVGAIMYLFIKKSLVKHIGEIIMGFGMLFTGIGIMKAAIVPLSQTAGFKTLMSGLDNPALALLFGVAFTALLQSSSSSTVIFQTFAVQGLLGYRTAVYLVIGAAIGSVTPNLLASLTTNRNGKRAALINLTFNIIRAAILITLISLVPGILDMIQGISPDNIGRQIANTHTIFAIIAVLIEAPFASKIIKLTEKILPVLPEELEQIEDRKLQFMINTKNVPVKIAMKQAQREIVRMGRISVKNLRRSLECFFDYDSEKAARVREREESVNILNHTIADAMAELRSREMDPEDVRRVSMMSIAVTDIERLSDHAENIVEYTEDMIKAKSSMTEDALDELRHMTEVTLEAVNLSIDIFETEDYSRLDRIEELESEVDDMQTELVNNHVKRLLANNCEPLAGVVFTDIVTDLERCSDHAINIAYALKERPAQLV
ncbi:MAG: Na/Pi cotransporter family protein [Firmicutes bacterium]|nr:Na/Pi cotransporter family protein [Bacillota bacterium]